jgi:hypothetical protein
MRRHARVSGRGARAGARDGYRAERTFDEFSEFFDEEDDDNTLDEYAEDEDEAIPTFLSDLPEWQDLYDAGIDYVEAARLVFDDLADLPDEQVRAELIEMTAEFGSDDAENFWRSLGRVAKSVARVAAPVVQAAAPILGTALGGPVGGLIGGALGRAAGAAMGSLGSRGGRHAPARAQLYRRPARATWQAPRGAAGASSQLLRLIQDPRIQRTLLGLVRGVATPLRTASGEAMSPQAVLAGIEGALLATAEEMQERGFDLASSNEGYGLADFDTSSGAFETLVSMVDEHEPS